MRRRFDLRNDSVDTEEFGLQQYSPRERCVVFGKFQVMVTHIVENDRKGLGRAIDKALARIITPPVGKHALEV